VCLFTRVSIAGEVMGQESVGRLGERVPVQCVPGARPNAFGQDVADRGQEKQNKAQSGYGFDQGLRGNTSGERDRAWEMAYAIRHANVHLGHKGKRESLG
jgi:hypothetical protein